MRYVDIKIMVQFFVLFLKIMIRRYHDPDDQLAILMTIYDVNMKMMIDDSWLSGS